MRQMGQMEAIQHSGHWQRQTAAVAVVRGNLLDLTAVAVVVLVLPRLERQQQEAAAQAAAVKLAVADKVVHEVEMAVKAAQAVAVVLLQEQAAVV